jgi:hypothetical protein
MIKKILLTLLLGVITTSRASQPENPIRELHKRVANSKEALKQAKIDHTNNSFCLTITNCEIAYYDSYIALSTALLKKPCAEAESTKLTQARDDAQRKLKDASDKRDRIILEYWISALVLMLEIIATHA